MGNTLISPGALLMEVSPGQSAGQTVTMTAPADASVSASVNSGDHVVSVKSITAIRYAWRDANENEQKQFLHLPGSITNARSRPAFWFLNKSERVMALRR